MCDGGVRRCATVCDGVRRCATVCDGVRRRATVCDGVRRCATVCDGVAQHDAGECKRDGQTQARVSQSVIQGLGRDHGVPVVQRQRITKVGVERRLEVIDHLKTCMHVD